MEQISPLATSTVREIKTDNRVNGSIEWAGVHEEPILGTGESESWSSCDPAGGPHYGPTDYFKGRCDRCTGSGWIE